ncbi:MAG TPA: hypothetical protein VI455_20860 [Terriglobia bacterium]
MKSFRSLLMLSISAFLTAALGLAGSDGAAQFDRVKSLAGEWQGKAADGRSVHLTYRSVSGGTAVLESIDNAGEPLMVTLYYRDGDHLMMTHYCMANNQPRMRADASNGDSIVFTFVDATNLSSPDAGHMNAHSITWKDADHVTQQWTWRQAGQEKVESFDLQRQK